ncbi:MAG: hypothetical protein DRI99_00130 [Candidatus Aminicenantes bacterium]|nr:MAG: hypothetical protein DRI99_00130 [Candidatus Aminicenantes bacterium]
MVHGNIYGVKYFIFHRLRTEFFLTISQSNLKTFSFSPPFSGSQGKSQFNRRERGKGGNFEPAGQKLFP